MVDVPAKARDLLRSGDEEERREAVLSLRGRADQETLGLLEGALGDESWRVRKAAVSVYRDYPQAGAAARSLIKALGDPDNAGLRGGAMEGLTLMGGQAVPYLLDTVNHPDNDVRKFVIDILGEIKDPRAVAKVLPLTDDPAEVIRLAAVEALGSIGGDRAFDALQGLLGGEDVSLQFSVLHSLGRVGKPIPLESIKPLFKQKILRRALFDALGQTRSPEAVDFLIDGLFDTAKSSRQAAVRALGNFASDGGMVDLVKQALRKKMDGKDLAPFEAFLDSGHMPTKKAAVTLLTLLGTEESTRLLVRAADDDSIQAEASEALDSLKDKEPAKVREVVRDEAPKLRSDTASVLSEPAPAKAVGPMGNEEFQRVRDLVSKEAGLHYDRELKYLVERRVQRRMERLGLDNYGVYLSLVEGSDDKGLGERRKLIGLLSTNETYFFREDFQLRAFQDEIVPMFRDRKKHNERFRVWSAGCSSGEEAYTIAILLLESGAFDPSLIDIMGSDISDNMIVKAKGGLYTESSFRATPEHYLKKYFRAEGNKQRLVDKVRSMVKFDSTNLVDCGQAPHLRKLDVIFCRNVIIYFSQEAKLRVVEQFYDLLNPGGFLLLGHSESLMNVSSSFELVHLKNDLVYRKPEAAG